MMWLVYFSSYLGRLNYTAVMGELIGNVLDKTQAGWVQTCFLVAYACGQVISGMLADRVSPGAFVALGAVGGGLANIAFAFSGSFLQMAVLRFLAGLLFSTLWPGMLCAMVRYMTSEDKLRAGVDIASSMSAGTLLAYGANSVILKHLSWSWAFILPGVLLCAVGVLWYALFPRALSYAVLPDGTARVSDKEAAPRLPIGRLILIPSLLVAILPTVFHGVIKDGVTAWVPAYLCEVHGQSPSFSSLLSMLLPLFNLAGAYMAKFVYDRAKENVFTSASLFFAAAFVCLGVMLIGAQTMLIPTVVCFALITSFMMAVNVILINFLPLKFECYGRTSTISGTLNAIAYGGSALASGLIGVMSERFGWSATVASWFFMMVVAFGLCFLFRRARHTVEKEVHTV